VSDTVAILNQGEIVASGPIEQILNGKDGVVYTLTMKGAAEGLRARLAQLPWVTHTMATRHNGTSRWQVSVDDATAAEARLLRYVLDDPALTVIDFNRKQYELEEVFMEIVGGNSHGN
jgi:ABC-type uncharacterized transport system ATPase subunit